MPKRTVVITETALLRTITLSPYGDRSIFPVSRTLAFGNAKVILSSLHPMYILTHPLKHARIKHEDS